MRKILTNPKIKFLFLYILLCILSFEFGTIVLLSLKPELAAFLLCLPVVMGVVMAVLCYRFFREQERIIEDAAAKVREYLSGNREARIECNEEGEWFRLFHEVNTLAAILNAKAENEGCARAALKNTISDISHQLKTPLAALNIYNGIIQTEAEAKKLPEIQEFSALSEQELDRIETLVQNLLKIAKFDAGTIAIEKKMENLSEMMADVKKRFLFRAGQEGKEIVLAGSESLSFLCDRNWIVEAVCNIVKNALDHTDCGDCVRIAWEESASVVH
nr:HAMP domain-containing histidine kinase [Lachnospiraceae bacterium]